MFTGPPVIVDDAEAVRRPLRATVDGKVRCPGARYEPTHESPPRACLVRLALPLLVAACAAAAAAPAAAMEPANPNLSAAA